MCGGHEQRGYETRGGDRRARGVASLPSETFGMSLTVRALLAILLTIGFYALAAAIAGLLLAFAISGLAGGEVDRATVFSLIGGVIVLWSILPRPRRFRAPGPRVDLAANPHLAEHLQDVARRVGEPLPPDVYVTLQMNAGVAQRGGLLGIGSRRFMVLGLPLMQLLTVSEFRAVLAHEFGHFRGGDTRLGPSIYRARQAIARTVQLAGSVSIVLWLPFRAYATLFFRITQAVSRAQEYAADALAASVVGAMPLAFALRKLPGGSLALDLYLRHELVPAIAAGFEPPVAAGFLHFVTREPTLALTTRFAQEQLARPPHDPYDSHPPTAARLSALATLPPGPDPSGEPAALVLLSQVPTLEQALVEGLRPAGTPPLRPVAWEQVGATVFLPAWQKQVRTHSALLAGATLGNLPEWAAAAAELGNRLATGASEAGQRGRAGGRQPASADPDRAREAGLRLLAAAVGVALAAQGWSAESLPGEPVTFRRGDQELAPLTAVRRLADRELDAQGWYRQIQELGLGNAWLATA